MRFRKSLMALALVLAGAGTASAQKYSAVYVFGDSTVDNGHYKAIASPWDNATMNAYWPAAVANGAGVPTSSPGPMRSQLLANYFGVDALPDNKGGTNYATGGAKNVATNTAQNGGPTAAIPTVTQIANYLSAKGNVADPNALYYVSSGGNDVIFANGNSGSGPPPADPNAYLSQVGASLANAIKSLQDAGAKAIVVDNLPQSFPTNNATQRALRATYNNALFGMLDSLVVKYVKGDVDAARLAIAAAPALYGLQHIDSGPGVSACVPPAGVTSAWASLCAANPGAPSQFMSATADLTSLFADDLHLATAGQRIVANAIYGKLPKATASALFSAALPASRSVQVGATATAFATIINSGAAALNGCRFAPVTDFPGRYLYQTTNPSTNALTGAANTPASIPAGGFQTFLMAFTASAPMVPADVTFAYVCAGEASAVPIVGVNTLKLVFDANLVPDIVALAATPRNDGVMHIVGISGSSAFAVATVNVGVGGAITAKPDTGTASIPLALTICETNPGTGQCLVPPAASVTTTINASATPTFAVFGTAAAAIAALPAINRVFVRFSDGGNVLRGSTSVAVQTE